MAASESWDSHRRAVADADAKGTSERGDRGHGCGDMGDRVTSASVSERDQKRRTMQDAVTRGEAVFLDRCERLVLLQDTPKGLDPVSLIRNPVSACLGRRIWCSSFRSAATRWLPAEITGWHHSERIKRLGKWKDSTGE